MDDIEIIPCDHSTITNPSTYALADRTRDLAKEDPEKLKALVVFCNRYAKQNSLIVTEDGPYKRGKECLVEDDLYE